MTPAQSHDFCDFLRKNTYATGPRDALIKDIESGAFAPGKQVDPLMVLKTYLHRIEAPACVFEHVDKIVLTSIDMSEALAIANAMLAERRSRPALDLSHLSAVEHDLEHMEETMGDALFHDGHFIDALTAESNERIARAAADEATFTPQ